jgi:hypothetical protein
MVKKQGREICIICILHHLLFINARFICVFASLIYIYLRSHSLTLIIYEEFKILNDLHNATDVCCSICTKSN